ncbi:hypothetical protein J3R83DRAFT_2479 [Lanmaoa asiatica]|nr:hypothetical protein J3R83DRAFT_2479 [Lanmaoa asiatica]
MFKNWQHTLATTTAGASKADAKTMSPTLRGDIYTALDQVKPWLIGATPRCAGDGVSYQPILAIIHKHFPDLKLGPRIRRERRGRSRSRRGWDHQHGPRNEQVGWYGRCNDDAYLGGRAQRGTWAHQATVRARVLRLGASAKNRSGVESRGGLIS